MLAKKDLRSIVDWSDENGKQFFVVIFRFLATFASITRILFEVTVLCQHNDKRKNEFADFYYSPFLRNILNAFNVPKYVAL